jgi:hypothetical protein
MAKTRTSKKPDTLSFQRQFLKSLLNEATGCHIQHTGWPCGTCFGALSLPGLSDAERNAMWQATLIVRGDYTNGEYIPRFSDAELAETIDRLLLALIGRRIGRLAEVAASA